MPEVERYCHTSLRCSPHINAKLEGNKSLYNCSSSDSGDNHWRMIPSRITTASLASLLLGKCLAFWSSEEKLWHFSCLCLLLQGVEWVTSFYEWLLLAVRDCRFYRHPEVSYSGHCELAFFVNCAQDKLLHTWDGEIVWLMKKHINMKGSWACQEIEDFLNEFTAQKLLRLLTGLFC